MWFGDCHASLAKTKEDCIHGVRDAIFWGLVSAFLF
jgi:hypothetical protein